jgi:hypothetical protein
MFLATEFKFPLLEFKAIAADKELGYLLPSLLNTLLKRLLSVFNIGVASLLIARMGYPSN